MKRLLAGLCAAALLISLTQSAEPFGMGREGRGFGKMGAQNMGGTAAPAGCASPTAPDGVVDFSKCSNAFYVAVIL